MKKISFLVMAIVIAFGITGCFVDEGVNMANEVVKETLTGKNAIENYEWFKQMEAGIKKKYRQEEKAQKSIDGFVEMLPKVRSEWSESDKGELQRLKMIKDGIAYSTDDMIADYEARCSMTNRSLFKDNLPTNIFRGVQGALQFKYNKKLEILPTSTN